MKEEYFWTVLDDSTTWGITEICALCRVDDALIHEMVNEGLLIPEGTSPETWRFNGLAVKRIQVTVRLQNDLRVNLPGAALALDLLEELDELRALLGQLR